MGIGHWRFRGMGIGLPSICLGVGIGFSSICLDQRGVCHIKIEIHHFTALPII